MQASEDQAQALYEMNRLKSVFLTGDAGTGKSTLIKEFIKMNPQRSIARLASTAAAAQLLEGETVHRFFGLKPTIYEPHSFRGDNYLRRKLQGVDCIIIDEVSMLRIDVFQAIRDRLFYAAKGVGPFAGYQVIAVGDFSQLPPVVAEEEEVHLERLYGPEQVFAFQSRYWSGLEHINLTQNHRQSDDAIFAQWLSGIRRGEAPDTDFINERVGHAREQATRLVTTVRAAEEINSQEAAKIKSGSYLIEGKVRGEFNARNMRVPSTMRLKPGSRVIICANNRNGGYVNGDAGELVKCERDQAGDPVARIRLDTGRMVRVSQAVWKDVRYHHDSKKGLKAQTQGYYQQMPLLPGWAITIHRSQGMSISNLHVDLRGVFAPGQAYVALSRAKSLDGLTLEAPISQDDFQFDTRVREFMGKYFAETPLPFHEPA